MGQFLLASKMFVEKRKQRRFIVQEDTLAALKNHEFRLGVIKDISRSGLAFQYIAEGNTLHGSCIIEEIINGKDRYRINIPVKIISDMEVDIPPFSFIPMRRCGLQFQEMTSYKISRVAELIEKYAVNNHRLMRKGG